MWATAEENVCRHVVVVLLRTQECMAEAPKDHVQRDPEAASLSPAVAPVVAPRRPWSASNAVLPDPVAGAASAARARCPDQDVARHRGRGYKQRRGLAAFCTVLMSVAVIFTVLGVFVPGGGGRLLPTTSLSLTTSGNFDRGP